MQAGDAGDNSMFSFDGSALAAKTKSMPAMKPPADPALKRPASEARLSMYAGKQRFGVQTFCWELNAHVPRC